MKQLLALKPDTPDKAVLAHTALFLWSLIPNNGATCEKKCETCQAVQRVVDVLKLHPAAQEVQQTNEKEKEPWLLG